MFPWRRIPFQNIYKKNQQTYLLKTIDHSSALNHGTGKWDLLTKDNLTAAYGIYVYHIEAPGVGERIGKMAIIK